MEKQGKKEEAVNSKERQPTDQAKSGNNKFDKKEKKEERKPIIKTKFSIPFTILSPEDLKKRIGFFIKFAKPNPESKLGQYLVNAEVNLTREEYIAICIKKLTVNFIFLAIFSTLGLYFLISNFYIYGPALSLLLSLFIFTLQINYPKLYDSRREKNIERNLIAALQDMLVQLNAGVPLFNIMVNISNSDYKELSDEFRKAVKKINAGIPQLKVLEELGEKNSSIYFRRTLWQISNGMRAGSDIAMVIRESIHSLTEEQVIQIQTYGNKLNPMIMFYMLISVIIPALSITFLTVIASIINLSEMMAIAMFSTIFFLVIIIQFVFVGIIKSIKPTLM